MQGGPGIAGFLRRSVLVGPHDPVAPARLGRSDNEQLIDIAFTVGERDELSLRVVASFGLGTLQGLHPAIALFFLDRCLFFEPLPLGFAGQRGIAANPRLRVQGA